MQIRTEINTLVNLGRLPDESEDDIPDDLIEKYEMLLSEITKPINSVEAEALIKLFPETALYGLEWTLLHIIESTPDWPINEIINLCPSKEWKEKMISRNKNV